MVDVAAKPVTRRSARAEAFVSLGAPVARELRRSGGLAKKGGLSEVVRVAGIMAAKRTAGLIPMCHPIPLDSVEVSVELDGSRLRIEAAVSCEARTGVEMEAMTAAAVAALAAYDMVKSAGRGVEIGPVRLLEKSGGRTGRWTRRAWGRGEA